MFAPRSGEFSQDCGGLQFVGFDFLFKADRAAKGGCSPMRDSGVLVPEKIRIKSHTSILLCVIEVFAKCA